MTKQLEFISLMHLRSSLKLTHHQLCMRVGCAWQKRLGLLFSLISDQVQTFLLPPPPLIPGQIFFWPSHFILAQVEPLATCFAALRAEERMGWTPVSGCTLLLFWSGGGAPWRSAVCQVSRCFWVHACVLPVDGVAHVWCRASAGRARLCAWRHSFGQVS